MRLAKENKSWGYDRIAGALANLGHEVADQTVGNILKRHGIPLAPERGVVAPLWLRAKSAYGGGRGMFEHEVSQALPRSLRRFALTLTRFRFFRSTT